MKITLNYFDIPKSAKFYKISTPLTKKLISAKLIELSKDKIGNSYSPIHRESVTTTSGDCALISSACFRTESEPTFLKNSNLKEIKYCFVMLIEFENYLAILKKNCSDPFVLLKEYLEEFTSKELAGYIVESDETYCEKLSVNGMSVGQYDILRKSYEAYNLMDSLPTFNSHRLIPRFAKFSEKDKNYSISVSTSRITESAEKGSVNCIVEWCFDFKSRIQRNTTSVFMEQFASSIDLKNLPTNIRPTGILLNISRILDGVSSGFELQYKGQKISPIRRNTLIRQGKKFFEVSGESINKFHLIGSHFYIIKNAKSFSLKARYLSHYTLKDVSKNTNQSLVSYINNKGLYDITFSDIGYFYSGRKLYRDTNMIHNVKHIIGVYRGVKEFGRVLTEKGQNFITESSVDFPVHSLFYRVQQYYKRTSDFIVCDDIGSQEWADHFIFNKVKTGSPRVVLVHSKAKENYSHGASEMQEVVAQAIKNLGKVKLSKEDLMNKESLWMSNYSPSIRG
jgi:hypothetical protein